MNPTIRKDILQHFGERALAVQTEVLSNARVSLIPAISEMLSYLESAPDLAKWRWSPIPEPRALVAEFFSGVGWEVKSMGASEVNFEFDPRRPDLPGGSEWSPELLSRAKEIRRSLLAKVLSLFIEGVSRGSPVRMSFVVKSWHLDALASLFPKLSFGRRDAYTIVYRPWDLHLPLPDSSPEDEDPSEDEDSSEDGSSQSGEP